MAVKASQVEESSWWKEILEAGLLDQHWLGIRNALNAGQNYPGLQHYSIDNEMVTYKCCTYILDSNALKLKVAYQCHDAKVAGHFVRDKTQDLMKRYYYWPNMEEWVRNCVRTCDACQRNKTARHKKYGKLVLLQIPSRPMEQVSMDFITDLPNVKGYNQCWVIIDRFTKMAHFNPLKNRKAKELALTFVREVWRLHELPKRVVSDLDAVFMSSFWSEIMRLLEVELGKSSAYHPQTDGKTERANQILEHYLSPYCLWARKTGLICCPLQSSATITLSILRPSRRHFSLLTTNTPRTTSRTLGITRPKATTLRQARRSRTWMP